MHICEYHHICEFALFPILVFKPIIIYFLLGGNDISGDLKTILSFDKTEEVWKPAGEMSVERNLQAIESIENISQLCPSTSGRIQ